MSSASLFTRLHRAVAYVAALEPARVMEVWRVLVILATAVGLVVTESVDARVTAAIGAVLLLADLLSTNVTRSRVVPTAKLPPDVVAAAAAGPLPGSKAATMSGNA